MAKLGEKTEGADADDRHGGAAGVPGELRLEDGRSKGRGNGERVRLDVDGGKI